MEAYFSNLFGDVRHERPLNLLKSLTNVAMIKPAGFTDHERKISKNVALGNLQRQKCLK